MPTLQENSDPQFVVQIISTQGDDQRRSIPFVVTTQELHEKLKDTERSDDDIILVIGEIQDGDLEIMAQPLITIRTFMQAHQTDENIEEIIKEEEKCQNAS